MAEWLDPTPPLVDGCGPGETPPNAANTIVAPGWILPSSSASVMAIGMVAAEVFPYEAMLT